MREYFGSEGRAARCLFHRFWVFLFCHHCYKELVQLQNIIAKLPFRGSVQVSLTVGAIDRGCYLETKAYQNLP